MKTIYGFDEPWYAGFREQCLAEEPNADNLSTATAICFLGSCVLSGLLAISQAIDRHGSAQANAIDGVSAEIETALNAIRESK